MQKVIRHNAIKDMFGYGWTRDDGYAFYFPSSLEGSDVAEFVNAQEDLVVDSELAHPTDLLPNGRTPEQGKEQALKTQLVDKAFAHTDLSERLEVKFNPLATPWQANFAGTLRDYMDLPVYVVVEGESMDLRDFLRTQSTVRLGAIAVNELNFCIEMRDSDEVASSLPRQYVAHHRPR